MSSTIKLDSVVRMCPILSIGKDKNRPCLRQKCMWFSEKNDDISIPNECSIKSINRNLLDLWLIIDKLRMGDIDEP